MNREQLERLAKLWRQQLVVREVLFSLAVAGVSVALFGWQATAFPWLTAAVVLAGALAFRFARSRPWELDAAALSRHLDRTHPELEESAALFLREPGGLTLLERLQRQRIDQQLLRHSGDLFGTPPRRFLQRAWWCLGLGSALAVGALIFSSHHAVPSAIASHGNATGRKPAAVTVNQPSAPPKIVSNTFTVTPPVYTARPERRVEGFNVEAEEGAQVRWSMVFDRAVRSCRLVAGLRTLPLASVGDNRWEGGIAEIHDSGLFTLTGVLPDGTPWNPPEIFSVKALKDQPPVVRIAQPVQTRTEVTTPIPGPMLIEAVVSDDYAVASARLVATVAKGSGESVKFREQNIPFDTDAPVDGSAHRRFTKTLDLAALGMTPGDELYFFVEAADNHQPKANLARSETRFLSWRGPEERKTSVGRGVAGVNLVPQYFRSERQLIIDTEKLVADRPTLSDPDFRARANDLGADQALLRLRYGRFLGEDQEQGLFTDHPETPLDPLQAAPPERAAGPRAAASIAERFRQEHTEQDQGGGGDENTSPQPPTDRNAPLTAEQIRQPFVDSHDIHDKNTFFDDNTQGTMRDALAAMWEAEKFLRTARPSEALAPEHRALDILKDLQQNARAYVQHVGFEAPPLRVAERRLKGDATGVPPRSSVPVNAAVADPSARNVRAALATLARGANLPPGLAADVESTLAAAATRQPEEFLPGLQALRRLRTDAPSPANSAALQTALLRLLPAALPLPTRPEQPPDALSVRYLQALRPVEASR